MKAFTSIPTPKSLPFLVCAIGHAMDVQKAAQKGKFHEQLYQWFKELGPIYKINVVNRNMVVVTDPTSIETVTRKAMENGGRASLVEIIEKVNAENNLPHSIATHDYEHWKKTRPLANVLLQTQLVNQLTPRISTLANEWSQKIKEMAELQPDGSYVFPNLRKCVNLFTLETIVAVTQGKRLGTTTPGKSVPEEVHQYITSVEDTISMTAQSINTFPLYKYFKTPFYKKLAEQYLFAYNYAKKVRFNQTGVPLQPINDEKSNLADVYYALGHKNGLSDEQILQVDTGAILGGVDTTSASIAITLYELAMNPQFQEEIYQEICSVMGLDPKSPAGSLAPIENSQFKKMHLLKNFVKDTMRKSPTVPINLRLLYDDVELQGYRIPKNTDIILFNYGVNRDEKYFENPLQVNPRRFENEEKDSKANEYTMQMFGLGERACPGKRIAMAEVYMIAANIIYQYKLECNAKDYELTGSGLISPVITDSNKIRFIPRK